MKTVIASVTCAVVAFAGWQGFYWTTKAKEPAPEPQAAEAPKSDEDKADPAEEPPPPRPKKSPPTTANKRTTAPKQFTSAPAQTTPKKATKTPPPSTDLYFTANGPYQQGIPASVTIYNTPFGTFKIVMLRSPYNTGKLFAGKGTKKVSGNLYAWEVEVRSGNVRVAFDGKNVPGRTQ